MLKEDFEENTRYALTVRRKSGKLQPANVYVYRRFDEFMIVRNTQNSGLLEKLCYGDVEKIVRSTAVPPAKQFAMPEALLQAKFWAEREFVEAYSSSPSVGK